MDHRTEDDEQVDPGSTEQGRQESVDYAARSLEMFRAPPCIRPRARWHTSSARCGRTW